MAPAPSRLAVAGLHGVAHSLPGSRVLSPWWLAAPSIDGGGHSPFPGVAGRVAALMLPAVMGALDCSPFPVAWCSRLPRGALPGVALSPVAPALPAPVAMAPPWHSLPGGACSLPAGLQVRALSWLQAPRLVGLLPAYCSGSPGGVCSPGSHPRGGGLETPSACRLVIPGAGVYR